MSSSENIATTNRYKQLVLHEESFLQSKAGRLRVLDKLKEPRQLEPFAVIILQQGEYQIEFLDEASVGKVWPRSATSIAEIQELDFQQNDMIFEVPQLKQMHEL
jgi:hypothetical protein